MPDIKKLVEGLKAFFTAERKLGFIVLLGILGMVLILISRFWGGDDMKLTASEEPPDPGLVQFTADAYAAGLEAKLCDLITGIEGVGHARVMVTLENNGQYVYAVEEKRNVDKTVEPQAEGEKDRVTSKENVQQSYILVDTSYGQRQALVETQLEPKVQGVVIVCEGAGNIHVKQSLINVVTTALNIPSTRVCVEKISVQNNKAIQEE